MMYLKYATAVTVKVGPFVDDANGVTEETALTISQADVRLSKNGGNFAQKSDTGSGTHDELGYYDIGLNTTDTGTLGILILVVHESGALPVRHEYMVVPAVVYDSLVGGSDYLQVDAVQIEGTDATNQINAEADTALSDYDAPTKAEMDTAHGLLATASALTTVDTVVDAIKAVTDNLPNSGSLSDLATILTDTAELQADWTNGGRLDLLIDAIKAVTDAIPDSGALTTLLGNVAAILADTGTDGVVLANDAITAAKIAADAITSSELATSAVTEIAQAVLKEDVGNVEDSAAVDSLAAMILAAFHSAIAGTVWTIKKQDDATTFDTKTIATSASIDPVSSVSD